MGMAYVIARRGGRFEVRESEHTAKGPRSRTLVCFRVLDDEVLARARARARRPFDAGAVLASARRAHAPGADGARAAAWLGGGSARRPEDAKARMRFVQASRRMAQATGASARGGPAAGLADPGEALIDLLGFADAVRAGQPPRPPRRLAFPPLAKIARSGRSQTG